jgi:hypothetical protein
MSIILRMENLDCRKICQEIERYIKIKKPDPSKTYLKIGLSDIVDGGDNHIPKLVMHQQPQLQEDQESK